MATRLTVALAGDPTDWLSGLRHPEDWEIPYVDRPKAVLDARDDETLRAVLARAATEFGVTPASWPDGSTARLDLAFISFYHPDRDTDLGRLRREVTLLDDQGRARWTSRWYDEPISEFVRAGAAGVLDGDPARPYLILQPGIGNGVLVDWPTFVELWNLWWDVADKAVVLGALVGWLRRQQKRGGPPPDETGDAIESRYREWQANGARPDNFAEFLGQRPWHEADLADALGCSPEIAEALLLAFGHERNTAGLWVPGSSQTAKLLQGQVELIIHAGMTTRVDAIEQVLRARGEKLAADGVAPDLDWQELRDLPTDHSRLPTLPDLPTESLRQNIALVLRYRAASALHRLRRLRDRPR